jgi:hypothetical protein
LACCDEAVTPPPAPKYTGEGGVAAVIAVARVWDFCAEIGDVARAVRRGTETADELVATLYE